MAATIDKQTKVTVGAALVIVSALLACAAWVTQGQKALHQEIKDVGDEVTAVRLEIASDYAKARELSTVSTIQGTIQARVAVLEALNEVKAAANRGD